MDKSSATGKDGLSREGMDLNDAARVDVEVEGTPVSVLPGVYRASDLKNSLGVSADRQLVMRLASIERTIADEDDVAISGSESLMTTDQLRYRPSSKHKRGRGYKGTLCPDGVDAQQMLLRSDIDPSRPRKRWAWRDGCAYCAHPDNVGGWHGWPVRLSEVPRPVWQAWLAESRITRRDLRRNLLCTP